ncbi:hypothetical protein AKJ16_DCAP26998 [Drosera capensis]
MGRCCGREYLVECDGRLLMLCDVLNTSGVDGFSVDEFDVGTRVAVGVEDLGGRALFVGRNETICVEDVERYRCEPNWGYHADMSCISHDEKKGMLQLRIPKSKAEVRSADLSSFVTDALPCSSTALALHVRG